jgi:hypothetical protein
MLNAEHKKKTAVFTEVSLPYTDVTVLCRPFCCKSVTKTAARTVSSTWRLDAQDFSKVMMFAVCF